MPCDVAIIGAGPYGLAAAAHLRRLKSLTVSIFGEPCASGGPPCRWNAAPFRLSASHIAGPHASLTLDAYKVSSGNHLAAPIPWNASLTTGYGISAPPYPTLIVAPYPASSRMLESSNQA